MVRSRTATAAAIIGSIAAATAVSAALASGPRRHPLRPSLPEGRLLHIALSAARGAGDPHPVLVQHSEGTRAEANRLTAGAADGGRALSYLIAERGRFVLADAPRPAGTPPPRGVVLTLVVDARSGHITDFGTSDRYPRLAALGPVTTDLAASVHGACPDRAPTSVDSSRPGADRVLVPPHARTVLLCRYVGTPGLLPGHLARQRLVSDQRTVLRLATALNAVPNTPAYPCPSGTGATTVAYFRYRSPPDDPVQIEMSGCQIVTNGLIARLAGVTARGRRFMAELARALGTRSG